MKRSSLGFFLVWIVICSSLLVGCGADTLDSVQDRGVLYIGMDPSYVPFEALAPDGELFGFDVDLSKEIANRLGVRVEFVFLSYDGLYSALEIEQVDMLVSALVIEPARMDDVAYSAGYFNAGLVLVTKDGGNVIRGMTDLENKTVAVEVAAEGDAEARRWSRRLRDLDILPLSTAKDALHSVLAGSSDAALVDGIEARLFVRENPGLILVSEPLTNELYAVVVRAGDNGLLRAIDDALEAMADDGAMDSIMERWFQVDPVYIP